VRPRILLGQTQTQYLIPVQASSDRPSTSYLCQAQDPPLTNTDPEPHTCARPRLLLRQTDPVPHTCAGLLRQTQHLIPARGPGSPSDRHRPSTSYLCRPPQTDPVPHTCARPRILLGQTQTQGLIPAPGPGSSSDRQTQHLIPVPGLASSSDRKIDPVPHTCTRPGLLLRQTQTQCLIPAPGLASSSDRPTASYLCQTWPPQTQTQHLIPGTRPSFSRQRRSASYLCQGWFPQKQTHCFIPGTRPHFLRHQQTSISYLARSSPLRH